MMRLYLDLDVLLLADVCSGIRQLIRNTFNIDAFHYPTLGALSYDMLLKCTNVELELISDDPTPYIFTEHGIVGGLAFVNGRYMESNNELTVKFDPGKTLQTGFLLDINSMYSTAMIENPLFIGGARFMSETEIANFDLHRDVDEQGEQGYLIQADISVPFETHDLLSLFPPLPRNKLIKYEHLSPYPKQLLEKNNENFPKRGTIRLIADLEDKKKYICQGVLLKFCVERLGLKITNIDKILVFNQKRWMEPHVRMLMRMRAASTTKLMNQLFKLLSNILYGKSIQGVRKYCQMFIVCSDILLQKLAQQRNFKNLKRIADGIYIVQMTVKRVYLNRAIIVGQQILDLSRLMFYKLIYEHILPAYGRQNIHIHMSDTDSILLRIIHHHCKDPYQALFPIKHILDTTNFPVNHPLYQARAPDELPGLLKCEITFPTQIERGYFIRAKCYLLILSENGEIKKLKGTTKAGAKKVTEKEFLECLHNENFIKTNQITIRSINSQLYTILQRKTAIGPTEYKRFYLNKYNSYAYGDCRIHFLSSGNIMIITPAEAIAKSKLM